MSQPAKLCPTYLAQLVVDHYVVRLDISVHDTHAMAVVQSLTGTQISARHTTTWTFGIGLAVLDCTLKDHNNPNSTISEGPIS